MNRSSVLQAATLCAAVVLASCSSNDTPESSAPTASAPTSSLGPSTTARESAPTQTTDRVTTTEATTTTVAALDTWGMEYVGGPGGVATGTPIRVGFVNQDSFSPESPGAAAAAVAYLNGELGGVGGRPLELVPCPIESEADAAGCASLLGDDPTVAMVMTGALQIGGTALYDGIANRKPVLIGSGLTAADFLTPNAHTYTVGGAGVVAGLTHFVATSLPQEPRKVAVVHLATAAGTTAISLFVQPLFAENSVDAVYVPVPDAATLADVSTALTAAGALDADVVLAIVNVPNCINLYDALTELGISPTVVSVGLCGSTPIADHLEDLGLTDTAPDGWYFGSNGYSQNIPNLEGGVDTYNAKIQRYGTPEPGSDTIDATGLAPLTFAATLTIAKLMNGLGEQATNPAALAAAVVGFTGPMMFQVGPLACGATTVVGVSFPSVCASQMGVQQYTNGTWTPVADANNGRPIDITTL